MDIPYRVRRLRPGSEQIWVYNSSGIVLLYDEGHADAIGAGQPSILESFSGEADLMDPVLRKLARNGLLLVYELYQDDEIMVELAVGGAALDAREVQGAAYLGPKCGRLNLPTGRLHIASHDTIAIGASRSGDPDAVVQVAPGSYVACVSWLDRARAVEVGEDEHFPSEFIALTPASQFTPKIPAAAILTHPERDDYWKKAVAKAKRSHGGDELRTYYDGIQKQFRRKWTYADGSPVHIDFSVQPDGTIVNPRINGSTYDEARAKAALAFLATQTLKPLPPLIVEKLGTLPVSYLF